MPKGEIYCIENLVNGKKYIGQTARGYQFRWELHQRDSTQPRCEHYPLYRALRKYGVENFKCYKIEDTDSPNERERYWIQFYNTYGKDGYNATAGGDGRSTVAVNDDDFIEAYYELGNVYKVAQKFQCTRTTVSQRLKKNGVELNKLGYNSKEVAKLDLDTQNILEIFPSFRAAARHIIDIGKTTSTNEISIASNIRRTANGKGKQAYGFAWELTDDQ